MPRPMHNPPPGFAMPTDEEYRRVVLERRRRPLSPAEQAIVDGGHC